MTPMFDTGELPIEIPGCTVRIAYIDSAGIPRTSYDAPIIRRPCPNSLEGTALPAEADYCIGGRVPGARASGKKCPTCKGAGELWKAYSRTTSYIAALESTDNVAKWRIRVLLRGLAQELGSYYRDEPSPTLDALTSFDWDTFDERDTKRTLNDLAESILAAGGVDQASDRGTHVHELTAEVDEGRPLPDHTYVRAKDMRIPVSLQDRADVAAWRRIVDELGIEFTAVERFVVLDELSVAGTLDRKGTVGARKICDLCDRPLVIDVKTGSVEYGGGKMPQQLAIYARAQEYDPETGVRTDQDLCTHRGLIVNVPAGSGDAKAYVADLEAGWESVALSTKVRQHRNESKKHLWPLDPS